jgi:hypothetical protein
MPSVAAIVAKAKSEKSPRAVAECVAALKGRGLSQSKIAAEIGRRDRLTKLLGMLGSNGDGEVDNAGRMADDLRRKLGMTWHDLIIASVEDAT